MPAGTIDLNRSNPNITGAVALNQEISSTEVKSTNAQPVTSKVQKVYEFIIAKFHELQAFFQKVGAAIQVKWSQCKGKIAELAKKCEAAFVRFAQAAIEKTFEFKAYLEKTFEVDLDTVAHKVVALAIQIAKIAAAAILFLSNSSVFVLGAVVGFAASNKMKEILDSGIRVWSDLKPLEKAAVAAAGSIAWPITLAMSAFFSGAAVSLYLQERAKNRQIQAQQIQAQQIQPVQQVVVEPTK